jgi:hypothetical protein
MRAFETDAKAAIDGGSIVRYRVIPQYVGPRTVPVAFEMYAYGTDRNGRPNFADATVVPNVLWSPRLGFLNLGAWSHTETGAPVPTGNTP